MALGFGAHLASALFPGAGATALPIEKFSRSPEVIAAAKSDPFVDQSDVPARTIAGLLDAMDRIAANRSMFTLPVLGMHGDADEITLPSGTRDFVGGVASKDRTLWSCPKLVHDLLHEPEGAAMIDGVTRWLEAHTTARGPGAEEATVQIDKSLAAPPAGAGPRMPEKVVGPVAPPSPCHAVTF